MNKLKKLLIGAALVVVPFSTAVMNVSAQTSKIGDSLGQVGNAAQLGGGGEDQLVNTVGSLITTFLGILGIVFLVLVLYAGFTWMTAMGEEKKIASAKNILISAVVGLVVIMSAYAISSFVIAQLQHATTGV